MDASPDIDQSKLPQHVAVIMDGNGRWAQQHGKARVYGHQHGVESVRQITEAAAEMGIPYLSLYAFSTENWNRPAYEVTALMTLLVQTIKNEIETLQKNQIRLQAVGNLDQLPRATHRALLRAIEQTQDNERMTLILALNYSGKWDITQAMQSLHASGAEVTQDAIEQHLSTAQWPDPELMIRTSGELRISNFFLWQLAYAELYFTDIMWPDFRKDHFRQAIADFQTRQRRFGKTGEQVS